MELVHKLGVGPLIKNNTGFAKKTVVLLANELGMPEHEIIDRLQKPWRKHNASKFNFRGRIRYLLLAVHAIGTITIAYDTVGWSPIIEKPNIRQGSPQMSVSLLSSREGITSFYI